MLRISFPLKCVCLFSAIGSILLTGIVYGQTFQNNNTSCEDKKVIGSFELMQPWTSIVNPHVPNQIVCGRYNDDSNLGAINFPDCVILRDVIPLDVQNIENGKSLSFLENAGVHGNNCLNAGGEAQFLDSVDLYNTAFMGDSNDTIFLGSLNKGNLDNDAQNFEDLAWINTNGSLTDPSDSTPSIQHLSPDINGGFLGSSFSPQNIPLANIDYKYTPLPSYFAGSASFEIGDLNKRQIGSDKSMLLADCNEDGLDDAILLVRTSQSENMTIEDDLNIMISVNNNGVLQTATTDDSLIALDDHITNDPMLDNGFGAVLAGADFNQDGHLDLVIASDQVSENEEIDGVALLCQGNGTCGFDCNSNDDSHIRSLELPCMGCRSAVHSLVAGDFNGDQRMDVAFSDSRNQRLRYFLNNGESFANWDTVEKDAVGLSFEGLAVPSYLTKGRFSTTAIQNETDEVVIAFLDYFVDDYNQITFSSVHAQSKLLFFPSDGQGGFLPLEEMFFDLPLLVRSVGLDTADLDRCGGDDLVVLSYQYEGQGNELVSGQSSLFLNENESPILQNQGSPNSGDINETLSLVASCTDPSIDDRSFTWEIISTPTGAQANLSALGGELSGKNDTEFSVQFTGDTPGEYVIELRCEDFCGLQAQESFLITLLEKEPVPEPEPEPIIEPEPIPEPILSQGGCISSLQNGSSQKSQWGVFQLSTLLLLSLVLRKFKKIVSYFNDL